jgi:hypothetical protein
MILGAKIYIIPSKTVPSGLTMQVTLYYLCGLHAEVFFLGCVASVWHAASRDIFFVVLSPMSVLK